MVDRGRKGGISRNLGAVVTTKRTIRAKAQRYVLLFHIYKKKRLG